MAEEAGASLDRAVAIHETLVAMFGLGDPDPRSLRAALEHVTPEEVASVIGDFGEDQKLKIFRALPSREEQGVVIEETDQRSRREILDGLEEAERHGVLGEMPVDDLVDHLGHFELEEQQRLIATLPTEDARDVRELLRYDPETAGGMMTTEFLSTPVGTTSRDALHTIQGDERAETISYVYVVEPDAKLQGVISIRQILRAPPPRLVDEYLERDVVRVHVDTDREEVAAIFDKYDYTALPVVDDEERIRGIVTFDDVIDIIQEEHSEDMLRMAGTTALHPLYEPIFKNVFKRLPFLLITMIGGLLVATAMDLFASEIVGVVVFSKMVIFVSLVNALSGNVAVVTSTMLVRGLAMGGFAAQRLRRVVLHQIFVGMAVSLFLSLLGGLEVWIFGWLVGEPAYGAPRVMVSLMVAMLAAVTWAGLVGALVPVLCHLSGRIDPAIASGPFVSATCDISGSVIFLAIIYLLIGTSWPV